MIARDENGVDRYYRAEAGGEIYQLWGFNGVPYWVHLTKWYSDASQEAAIEYSKRRAFSSAGHPMCRCVENNGETSLG